MDIDIVKLYFLVTELYLCMFVANCLCSASGDPHYRTFDGQWIHFMGICKYTLSKAAMNDPCDFNVEVKNEHRYGNMRVSYTRLVDFQIYGKTIRLHQNKIVIVRIYQAT